MQKPKLILGILMHDAGREFGCYGVPDVKTPAIDRLAAEGVRFTNHFSTGTVCIPSRASVLTGRYLHNAEVCYYTNPGVETIPIALRRAGYESYRFGFAEEKEYRGVAGFPCPAPYDETGVKLLGYDHSRTDSAAAADVAEQVIDTLRNWDRQKPLYISAVFGEAHAPYDSIPVTEEEIRSSVLPPKLPQLPDVRPAHKMLAQLHKKVTMGDHGVARICDYLREVGLYEDTFLYFSCDHGIDFPRAKQSAYDSGTGVPLIFWGGAVPQGLVAEGLSSHVDILPTLCAVADIPAPAGISGISQLEQLTGGPGTRTAIFSEVSLDNRDAPVRAIRTDRHRLLINFNPGIPPATGHSFTDNVGYELLTEIYGTPRPAEELYDLAADPCELHNLADDPAYAEIKTGLKARLLRELAFTNDEILYPHSSYADPDLVHPVDRWVLQDDGKYRLEPPKR